jgi:hypothetical protein
MISIWWSVRSSGRHFSSFPDRPTPAKLGINSGCSQNAKTYHLIFSQNSRSIPICRIYMSYLHQFFKPCCLQSFVTALGWIKFAHLGCSISGYLGIVAKLFPESDETSRITKVRDSKPYPVVFWRTSITISWCHKNLQGFSWFPWTYLMITRRSRTCRNFPKEQSDWHGFWREFWQLHQRDHSEESDGVDLNDDLDHLHSSWNWLNKNPKILWISTRGFDVDSLSRDLWNLSDMWQSASRVESLFAFREPSHSWSS